MRALQPSDRDGSHQQPAEDHVEKLLDEALRETFPASDPVAVSSAAYALVEAVERPRREHG